MAAVRLTERFAFSGGKVHREGAVPYVENVIICGFTSQNSRDYKPEAWAGERVKRYNGRPVYVNHAAERTAESKLGWFEDVKVGESGKPVGRFCINPKHPLAESVLWAAENKPDFYGMSHVADCDVTRSNGREVIEEIISVASIDLVAEPATVRGFYESKGGGSVGKIKLAEWVKQIGPRLKNPDLWSGLKKISEDYGDGMMMDAPPAAAAADNPGDDAADAEPEDLKSSLMSAITPMLEEAFESGDAAKVCSAIKDFIKLHAKHTGGGDSGDSDSKSDDEKPRDEAKKPSADTSIREAIEVCRKVGFKGFDADDLDVISATPAARREVVARKLMGSGSTAGGKGEETPSSRTREGITTPPKGVKESAPASAKEYAALIRG